MASGQAKASPKIQNSDSKQKYAAVSYPFPTSGSPLDSSAAKVVHASIPHHSILNYHRVPVCTTEYQFVLQSTNSTVLLFSLITECQ